MIEGRPGYKGPRHSVRSTRQPFSIKTQTVDGSIEWMPSRTESTNACFSIKARSFSEVGEDQKRYDSYVLEPGAIILAHVGFLLELLPGWVAQFRTKMDLMLTNGLSVLDSQGLVENTDRSELNVVLINNGEEDIDLNRGDVVAQMVVTKVPHVKLWHVEEISEPPNK